MTRRISSTEEIAGEGEAHPVVAERRHALPYGGGEDLLRRALDERPHLAVHGHDLAERDPARVARVPWHFVQPTAA